MLRPERGDASASRGAKVDGRNRSFASVNYALLAKPCD
jgi:hypothetical protein